MWRLNNEDRGASMVFIAICLVFLIGFAGLAVDVGALYAERTELQKGADAAVLAIAEDCGHGTKPCDVPTASATAEDYIDANATDLAGALDSLVLDLAAQEVTVIDATERSDGGSIFLPFFAQVIGWEGMTVKAQASAAWGAPSGMATLPIIISECEWDKYKDDPDAWQDEPYPVAPDLPEPLLLMFHDGTGKKSEDCNAVAGQDADGDGRLPGGFGWLDPDAGCETETSDDDWAEKDSGADTPKECTVEYIKSLVGKVVFVPWFDDVDPKYGKNGGYHIAGYSPFYITGFSWEGQYKVKSLYDGEFPCKGDDRCLEGYFTTGTAYDGDLGGEFRGVLIVILTG